jgi:hypothetical protein
LVYSHFSGSRGSVCKSTEIGHKNTLPEVGSEERSLFKEAEPTDFLKTLFGRVLANGRHYFFKIIPNFDCEEFKVRNQLSFDFFHP